MFGDTQHQTDRYGSPGRATAVLRSKTMHWWDDHREIAALLRWLYESHNFDAEELIPVVEKPYKWDVEWNLMCRERSRSNDNSHSQKEQHADISDLATDEEQMP